MSLLLLFNPTTQGTVPPGIVVTVAGVDRSRYTKLQDNEVSQQTGGQPDEATLVFRNFTPANGDLVTIVEGSITHFSGRIAKVSRRRQRSADRTTYVCTCLDARQLFNRRLVTKNWVGQTAYDVIADIVANFSSGFTYARVSAALLAYTVTNLATGQQPSDVMDQVLEPIGGQWRIDETLDVHASVDEEASVAPEAIDSTNVRVSGFAYEPDWTPIRNRVYVEGGGVNALAAAAVGDTSLQVEDGDWYSASGGTVVSGPQRVTYTGVSSGSSSTPATPTAGKAYLAPSAIATGININTVAGVSTVTHTAHGYSTGQQIVITIDSTSGGTGSYTSRYTITVVNANSYTLNSGPAGTTTGTSLVIRPSVPATATAKIGTATVTCTAHGFATGMKVRGYYALNASGGTVSSYQALLGPITVVDANTFTCAMSGYPADVTFAVIAATSGSLSGAYTYRLTDNVSGSESLGSVATSSVTVEQVTSVPGTYGFSTGVGTGLILNKNYTYGVTAVTADGETSVLTTQRVNTGGGAGSVTGLLTAIKLTNDPRVTGRNIWRTTADGADSIAALQYVGTISDDTTQTFTDTVSDANLGAYAPTVNTTGGAVKLTGIAVSANTRSSGREVYRPVASGTTHQHVGTVSGTTATTFTDTASDAAQATGVALPTTASLPASLTGIPPSGAGSILYAIKRGDPVNILVQANDTASQAIVAAAEGGDGIHEFYLQDRDLSLAAAAVRAQAELLLGAPPRETLTFSTPDLHIRAGKRVYIDLGGYTGYARIQTARLSWPEGRTMFSVTCSSQLYDLYHVLRQLQAQGRAA